MKKVLLLILFFFSLAKINAQLDREHWFAPMVDRTGPTSAYPRYQTLYLSTNRTTPFPVNIYNNSTLIGTVTISKGSPQKFDVLRDYIITTDQAQTFTPTNMGLNVKADFAFFANLRFSVVNHAEIITSKGLASLGTEFRTAMAPITVSNTILNFMTSVIATEDQTTVTITGYQAGTQFSNGTTGTTNPTLTFTLNKGQSYIIDGNGGNTANANAFIGAKITSTKPINVTNGNFNGQYAGNIANSSDILMDQAVPVNKLGNEFALVKGNGSLTSTMESALVVATEDNTQIFVNNEIPPIATINAGQYYIVPGTKYINQGNEHYNLYIKTSKNAYVYQLLAGSPASSGTEEATGGFNFIPALTCYLPKQIDEIGLINENLVITNNNPSGILDIPTKLNLITETGATVFVNGIPPLAIYGPYTMTGNPNWVSYGIPNTVGTITVTSSKAITAGISAGSDAVGYGGFFAGFYAQPIVVKSGGDCVPGIVLTVDPTNYDTYQWYRNGFIIPGAIFSSYTPTQPGFYTCQVTMGTCAPLITEAFKVLNCTVNTQNMQNICSTYTVNPTFTNSTQTINIGSIAITTPPTNGNVTINTTTGAITYTANTAFQNGTDTFTYQFCGVDPDFPDCESITVQINVSNPIVQNATLTSCNTNNGLGIFNLTTANVTTSTPVTTTYYPTLADAQNENAAALIGSPTTYSSANGNIVFAVVKNNIGCKKIAQITLNLFPLAVISAYNGIFCDDNFDGTITVTLSTITASVLNNPTYFTNVRYYGTLANANAGNAATLPNNYSFTANTTIYIRVDSPDGCPPIIQAIPLNFGSKVPLIRSIAEEIICDDDFDGIKDINLSTFSTTFTNDPAVSLTFHNSLADAQNNSGAINPSFSASGTQTYYVRFQKAGLCPEIGTLKITVRAAKKSDVLVDQEICPGSMVELDAGPGFERYLWSTGATSQSITVPSGNYWVELTFNGCTYRQNVTVTATPLPVITSIEIDGSTVTVNVSSGTPPFEFSIDGANWQDSNVFYNVPKGPNMIYVRDKNRCKIIQKEFFIINLINTITPNNDGINDAIRYPELISKKNVVFKIFDRYGAQQFEGTPQNNYTWDGYLGKRPVPTATYWYFIQWSEEGSDIIYKYSSWLLVKHRGDNYVPRK